MRGKEVASDSELWTDHNIDTWARAPDPAGEGLAAGG